MKYKRRSCYHLLIHAKILYDMFAHFVSDFLGFSVHEFPEKSENPGTFLSDCTLYIWLVCDINPHNN